MHPTRIPMAPSGNAREVNWFRNLLQCVLERSIRVGPGLRASHEKGGTLIELSGRMERGAADASPVQRFYVDFVLPNFLICRRSDDDGNPIGDPPLSAASPSAYLVAKPPELREDTYNGVTTTYLGNTFTFSYSEGQRQVSDGARYFTEEMTPPYASGDNEIYAAKPIGKTGYTYDDGDGFVKQLEWIDLNVSARVFKPRMTLVATCSIEGGVEVVRYMWVAGGPIQA